MADEPEKDIKDTVLPESEETTPDSEVVPPTVNDTPDDDVRDTIKALTEKVEGLAAMVSEVIQGNNTEPDTKPVKRPWTHWGANR